MCDVLYFRLRQHLKASLLPQRPQSCLLSCGGHPPFLSRLRTEPTELDRPTLWTSTTWEAQELWMIRSSTFYTIRNSPPLTLRMAPRRVSILTRLPLKTCLLKSLQIRMAQCNVLSRTDCQLESKPYSNNSLTTKSLTLSTREPKTKVRLSKRTLKVVKVKDSPHKLQTGTKKSREQKM